MLYCLYQYFHNLDIPGAGLLQYLSFRSGAAFVIALLILMPFGNWFIKKLRQYQIGEEIRDLGLEGQQQKRGTPTMGGILIVGATLVPVLLLADLRNVYVLVMLVATVWLGLLGAQDDYIKVFRHRKKGLSGWVKLAGQALLGLFVGAMLFLSPEVGVRLPQSSMVESEVEVLAESAGRTVHLSPLEKSLKTTIPFLKNNELDYRSMIPVGGDAGNWLAWGLFVVVVVVVVAAVSNGANLTDGLDGLATGVSVPIVLTLGIFAYLSGNVIYSSYLKIMYIPEMGELVVYMSAFLGALVGFFWFNSFPAQVFMGDTGSLTIGGIIGVFAVLVRKELLLPILCGVFLVESLSVMMQVGYFKFTRLRYGEGRRILLMAPLHHHYQKKGVPEPRIVARFWVVSVLLAVLTVVTLKIR